MGPSAALAKKELIESRWRLAVSAALMTAVAVSIPVLFDWIRGYLGGVDISGGWEGTITAQLEDYRLYLWSNWWGKNHSQIMAVLALIWGMGLIARDRENGVLAYILSRPVGRGRLLAVRMAVAGVCLATVSLISTAVLMIASRFSQGEGVPWYILGGWPQSFLGIMAVLTMTGMFSVLIRDRIMVLVVSLVITVAATVVGLVPAFRSISPLHLMSASGTQESGRLEILPMAGLAVFSATMYVIARAGMRRLEL